MANCCCLNDNFIRILFRSQMSMHFYLNINTPIYFTILECYTVMSDNLYSYISVAHILSLSFWLPTDGQLFYVRYKGTT